MLNVILSFEINIESYSIVRKSVGEKSSFTFYKRLNDYSILN